MPYISRYLSASRPWRPTDFGSALAVWYDAANASAITVSGGVVTSWLDQSGNNLHAFPDTGSNPSYNAATGATPLDAYVNFSATTMYLYSKSQNLTYPLGGASRAMFGVYTPQGTAGGNPYFSYGNGGTGLNFGISNFNGHDPYLAGYSADCDSGIAYAAGTRLMATATYNAGTESIAKNGGTPVTAANTLNTPTGFPFMLATSWYSSQTVCYLHEIVLVAGNLTTGQIQTVEGYLAWKWGLVSSLPSTHAYKNTAPKG